MWSCIAHTCYFVLFAVLQSFLRCPVFSRVMLLFIVPLNAAAEVNQQPALDLTSLSLLLVTLSLGIDLRRQCSPLQSAPLTCCRHGCRSLVCKSAVGVRPHWREEDHSAPTGPTGTRRAAEFGFIPSVVSTFFNTAEVSERLRVGNTQSVCVRPRKLDVLCSYGFKSTSLQSKPLI